MDKTTAIGAPGNGSMVSGEMVSGEKIVSPQEHVALTEAVRESVRRSTLRLIKHLDPKDEARACPICGERVIHLDAPESFTYDRARRARICKACSAERDLVLIVQPEADIGGEGG